MSKNDRKTPVVNGRWRLILLGGVLITSLSLGLWWLTADETRVGALAPQAPQQQSLAGAVPDFAWRGYQIRPLAALQMQARVLGIAWYPDGVGADIAPLDLALGWGPMSDEAVLSAFQISQSQRWYSLSAPKSPISMYSAAQHSANMHIIPANQGLRERLRQLRVGDLLELSGWLVNVSGKDWHIESSLTRDDRGAGACELVYLLSLEKLP